jgi:phosphopantothenoylcysteine decarboxylase / phosphopantothenate---cysteine ligase
MTDLLNKKILLGITGGIAAYKSAELCRLLIKAGAEVRVVMTPAACEFIQPLTFQALSGHRVLTDIFDGDAESAMDHIDLGRWCDFLLVAPASADFLAKFRNGYADNILLTLCLACDKDIAVAPAMNQQMYASEATQHNITELVQRKILLWGPNAGEQACGEVGPGRMLEPVELTENVANFFRPGSLQNRRVLITAGPTREAIDPVRYVSNHSSGKMGFAIAEAALKAGAEVCLVSGPVSLKTPSRANRIDVVSAREMFDVVERNLENCDIFIACAAISDYRVAEISDQKMKKNGGELNLKLIQNPDILRSVAERKSGRPFCVGFAAETNNLATYALDKLESKKLDMIAANLVGNDKTGFAGDANELEVFWASGSQKIPYAPKSVIATSLVELITLQFLKS